MFVTVEGIFFLILTGQKQIIHVSGPHLPHKPNLMKLGFFFFSHTHNVKIREKKNETWLYVIQNLYFSFKIYTSPNLTYDLDRFWYKRLVK